MTFESRPPRSDNEVVGPLLLGRYRPLELLARGGTSLVYRGQDEHLQRAVALKVFSSGGQAVLDQFHDEVRVLAGLSHHGVVSITDAGIDDSTPTDPRPFLVMELVRGETLRAIIGSSSLSAHRIGEIGFEVAEALEYIHARGVIHRDITPSNIMLVDYGTTFSRPRVRLTDFGIAVSSGSGSATTVSADGSATGTAAYLSPEQVRNLPLTPASDIYNLGLVLLECFTGQLAFPGHAVESALSRIDTDPDVPDSVPAAWRDLISAMTSQEAEDRPSAVQVATAARIQLRSSARHGGQ